MVMGRRRMHKLCFEVWVNRTPAHCAATSLQRTQCIGLHPRAVIATRVPWHDYCRLAVLRSNTSSMPPRIAAFLRKAVSCSWKSASSALQKPWKIAVTGTRKAASASAAQRDCQPMTNSNPPITSMAMVSPSNIDANGRPALAIQPATPAKPKILPMPETTNSVPSSARPMRNMVLEEGVLFAVFMTMFPGASKRKVEQEHFGVLCLVEGDFGFVADLQRVAAGQHDAVDGDAAADHVHVGSATGLQCMGDAVVAIEDRRVQPRVLMDQHRAVATVGRTHQAQAA